MAIPIPKGSLDGRALVVPKDNPLVLVRIDDSWPYKDHWVRETQKNLTAKIGDSLTFAFLDLEQGIQETVSVNYADSDVVGRVEAYKTYVGNSNREIPLTFAFQAQGDKVKTFRDALEQEVLLPARWLESLKFPFISPDGITHAPPFLYLQIGALLSGRFILTEAQLTWKPPFDSVTMLPYGAEVQCTFVAVSSVIKNYTYGRRF